MRRIPRSSVLRTGRTRKVYLFTSEGRLPCKDSRHRATGEYEHDTESGLRTVVRTGERQRAASGGYGYMLEYPIARAYADARVTTIYGGTTEIMKEIIGKSLGL